MRVSCKHLRVRRWLWKTADCATGEVCDECVRAVVFGWPDLVSLTRSDLLELPLETPGEAVVHR